MNKKVQKSLLDMYEHTCHGGRGSVKYFMEQTRADKKFEYFLTRTLTYFNPGGTSFTAPQFVLLAWNLLTLQHNVDGAAEWSFRVWFGGEDYSVEAEAERKNVFEMLDSSLGLSAKYDYRPGSEKFKKMKGFVGNSHEYDTKRGQALMNTCCGSGGDVDCKGFMRLAARAKPVTKFPYPVCDELRTQMKNSKAWDKMCMQRRQCNELDSIIDRIKKDSPMCLGSVEPKRKKGKMYQDKDEKKGSGGGGGGGGKKLGLQKKKAATSIQAKEKNSKSRYRTSKYGFKQ